MSIAIGLDFGSLDLRGAYVSGEEVISVPRPAAEGTWCSWLFIDAASEGGPLGFTFTSLKHRVGDPKRFPWRGAEVLPEDAIQDTIASIKRAMEIYAGDEVSSAVISVPALYSARRRALLRTVAEDAGLGHVELINDCTAAALGHTHGADEAARTLLVFSMGYSGLEVAVVRSTHQRLRELVHEGLPAPSGRDFDLKIMLAAMETLRSQNMALPVRVFTSQWFDFRYLASGVKERLSLHDVAALELPSYITGGEAVRIQFDRAHLEQFIAPDVERAVALVRAALDEVDMAPEHISEVVLVGGSTKIGLIQQQLSSLLGDKLVQPRDDLLALGAALQAERIRQEPAAGDACPEPQPIPMPPATTPPEEPEPAPSPDASRPAPPEADAVFDYAQRLAGAGDREAALAYLEQLELRARTLREQLGGT